MAYDESTMPDADDAAKLSKEVAEQVRVLRPTVDPERRSDLEGWLGSMIPSARRRIKEKWEERHQLWQATLEGTRLDPPMRRDASNLSVPLTIWAAAAVRARLRGGSTEATNIVAVRPALSAANDGTDLNATSEYLSRWLEAEFRSPRALDGLNSVNKAIAAASNYGCGALKLVVENDQVKYLPRWGTADLVEVIVRGRPRWVSIRFDDMIFPECAGNDTNNMAYVGHVTTFTWQELQYLAAIDAIDKDKLDKVRAHYTERREMNGEEMLAPHRGHDIAEVYVDYPIGGKSGAWPVPLMCYWHVEAECLLGVNFNYTPGGRKPIWLLPFDDRPNPEETGGQGVCEKLEGAQDETDVIHNLGIEAAKRVVASVIGLATNSGAEREFGGNKSVLPGDTYVTEKPGEDLVVTPLGSIAGFEVAQAQEQASRMYVMRSLGLDETVLGNVESGKRVPASLGLSTQREGRAIISHAMSNLARTLTDMMYVTLETYRLRLPADTLHAVLPPDAVRVLMDSVFAATDVDLRSRFILQVSAVDVSAIEEAQKQELLLVGQFLQSYFDRLIQYAQMAMQLPEPLQNALLLVMQKQEAAAKALLRTVESIQNPEDVLPSVAQIAEAIRGVANSAVGAAPTQGGGI